MFPYLPMTGTNQPAVNNKPTKVFNPLPWQVPAWRDKSPIILLTGSAGGGKSQIALEKINGYCLKYPNAFALLVRKVKVSMTSGTSLFFEDEIALSKTETALAGASHVPSKSRFEYANGSMVVYIGLEDKKQLERLKSIGKKGGVDIAFMEEATEFTEQDYNAIRARMRGKVASWRQVILACNPDSPTHWIYRRLIQGGEAKVYYSSAKDNYYNPDDYLTTLDSLTGVDKKRLAEGMWVQASGIVYDTWVDGPDGGNVTTEAEYVHDGGDIYWGVDDGYAGEIDPISGFYTAQSHPRVFLYAQLKADGHLDIFDENYATQTMQEIHVAEAVNSPYPLPTFAAVDKSALELKSRLYENGIYTRNSPSSVEESIKSVREWISPDKNGWRRVRVHPRCKHLRAEMMSYAYDHNEKPAKQFDHGPDALRYLIWTLRRE